METGKDPGRPNGTSSGGLRGYSGIDVRQLWCHLQRRAYARRMHSCGHYRQM